MKKKFLTLLLTAVGLVMSSTAWAEVTGTGTETDPYMVSSLDELQSTLGTATAGSYITATATIETSGTVTINLNGCKLNCSVNDVIDNTGVLIINGADASGNKGTINGNGSVYLVGIYNTGTLTINNAIVTASSSASYGVAGIYNSGTLSISNSTVTATYTGTTSMDAYAILNYGGSSAFSATITSCDLSATNTNFPAREFTCYNRGASGKKVTVTFSGNGTYGNVTNYSAVYATVTATGGSFSVDPTSFLTNADAVTYGVKLADSEDTNYHIYKMSEHPEAVAAQVDGTNYGTLSAAFAVANGKTMKVMNNATAAATMTLGANNVTFDLNGKNVTCSLSSMFTLNSTGSLTLKDGSTSTKGTIIGTGFTQVISGKTYQIVTNIINASSNAAAGTVNVSDVNLKSGNIFIVGASATTKINISSGCFDGNLNIKNTASNTTITGGKFSANPGSFNIPDGYVVSEISEGNYKYEVVAVSGEAVATIGTTTYTTLGAAVNAATSGQTIKLHKDNAEPITDFPVGVTLSFGSHTHGTITTVSGYKISEASGSLTPVLRDGSEEDTYVAILNADGTVAAYHKSLTDADATITSGQTLKMINSFTGGVYDYFEMSKSTTLDLNGKSISSAHGSYVIMVDEGASLKITDGTESPGSIVSTNAYYGVCLENHGTLAIEKVTLDAVTTPQTKGYGVSNYGDMTMVSGTINAKTCGIYAETTTTANSVTIQGGTIEAWDGIESMGTTAIGTNATVTISGGTINATNFALTGNGNNTASGASYANTIWNISGGMLTSSTSSALYHPQAGLTTITGGTLTGVHSGIAVKSGTLNISGGTITATGVDESPTEGWSGGVNASGAAIQIESNKDYVGNPDNENYNTYKDAYGPIVINITSNDAVLTSEKGLTIYEYLADNNATSKTSVSSMSVSAGLFKSGVEPTVTVDGVQIERKAIYKFSQELGESSVAQGFVSGGHYSHVFPVNYIALDAEGKAQGLISCPSSDYTDIHNADYKYTLGKVNADKGDDAGKYILDEYPGISTSDVTKPITVAEWESGKLATFPNTVGVITSSVSNNAFAKSTKNVCVKKTISGVDTYVCPNFEITDLSTIENVASHLTEAENTKYYAPSKFKAQKLYFKRHLSHGYNSVCVPFAITEDMFGENELLQYASKDLEQHKVYFSYVNSVAAGQPIIIYIPETEGRDWVVDEENVTVACSTAQGTDIKGVYCKTEFKNSDGMWSVNNTDGTFVQIGGASGKGYLYPFRACIYLGDQKMYQDQSSSAPFHLEILPPTTPGTATGLDAISAQGQNEKFLQNGRLFIRHNGQLFDAAGKVVK